MVFSQYYVAARIVCTGILTFRCVQPIDTGETVTVSYTDLHLPHRLRHHGLLEHFLFRCLCPRCVLFCDLPPPLPSTPLTVTGGVIGETAESSREVEKKLSSWFCLSLSCHGTMVPSVPVGEEGGGGEGGGEGNGLATAAAAATGAGGSGGGEGGPGARGRLKHSEGAGETEPQFPLLKLRCDQCGMKSGEEYEKKEDAWLEAIDQVLDLILKGHFTQAETGKEI
jgi:hypothetical protein